MEEVEEEEKDDEDDERATGEKRNFKTCKKKADELFVNERREGSKKRTKVIYLSLTRRRFLISKRRRLGRSGVVSLRGGSDDAHRSCAFE